MIISQFRSWQVKVKRAGFSKWQTIDLALARDDGFQPHERKYIELRISFARNELDFDPINGQTVRTANSENCSELLSVRNVKLKDARVVMHGYSSQAIENQKSFVSYRRFAYGFEIVILKQYKKMLIYKFFPLVNRPNRDAALWLQELR